MHDYHYIYFAIKEEETPEMRDLHRYVIKTHAPHWRDIGIELKLKITTLDIISRDNPLNCIACFGRTLDKWLKSNPDASWGALEVAITNVRRAELGLEPVNDVYGKCVTISGRYVFFTVGIFLYVCLSN